ncbi:MAG: BamA/TamA family outer membrane protein [Silvibacterium sp.]|nr:BamA/TamA family outer membrane protein [Silvibacterium sp.]
MWAAGRGVRVAIAALLSLGWCASLPGIAQAVPPVSTPGNPTAPPSTASNAAPDSLRSWEGLLVTAVSFEGVDRLRLEPLPAQLPLQPGKRLDPSDVRQSLRRLFETGLYKGIEVEGIRNGDRVTIIFKGTPTLFLGRITVEGVKSDRLTSQLVHATRFNPGSPFTDTKMGQADNNLLDLLQDHGYYQGSVAQSTTIDATDAQINVHFHVITGKQARIGNVKVDGNPGMSVETFRKKGKLKHGAKVTHDTVSRALSGVQKAYRKQQRLEGSVALESKSFEKETGFLDYGFQANQGPVVTIRVNGVKLSKGKVKNLVPVYQEGADDEDLLNEGDRRLRDYYQRDGYFDVKVTHQKTESPNLTLIEYTVNLGQRQKVDSVKVTGNKYFGRDIIEPRLGVVKANTFQRHGSYSQALLQADVVNITTLYKSNGFDEVKVTPVVKDLPPSKPGDKDPGLTVTYQIDEGIQQKIGRYEVNGNERIPTSELKPLLNLESGQPYSAAAIIGDRDSILTYYFKHGFSKASIAIEQNTEKNNPDLTDVIFNVYEGNQTFVDRVLISGLHYTRESTIEPHILLHPGDPLDQSALFDMQRQMYDLTLFNEVNTAVQNPAGDQERKNVLVQFTEAKRWDIGYGAGFQIQTGNPQTNCPNTVTLVQEGINPATYQGCGTNAKTGASALVQFDVSRTNLRGTNKSITLRTLYGSLEQSETLIYSSPHIFNDPKWDFSLSGGYTNAQDITTFASSRLEGSVRFTNRPSLPNTLIYQFIYRRVKVDPNSVQVPPDQIPLVSEPVRVAGPSFTWIRDTRRPTPLDAHFGTYTSTQEFFTDNVFSAEANFNRLDITNASYYSIGKKGFVIARQTRFGYERSFGEDQFRYIPLPERLYAGGAQSLRGFSLNSAGPRDSLTGFPVGGAGAFVNNTELRLPNPTLPYFGTALGFVIFHDTGNVFNNSSDIWPSLIRIKQPHSWTCKILNEELQSQITRHSSTNPYGLCDFNDFSHAVGLGLRYHTPIGPVRFDFSYNLNPPIYPVIITYGTQSNGQPIPAHVGQAGHFNFFFSIGQAF